MRRYEQRTLWRFMLLFSSALLLWQLLLILWYGYTQNTRIKTEERVAAALHAKQCARLKALSPNPATFTCTLRLRHFEPERHQLYLELITMTLLSLFFSLIASFLLARLSIKPMKEALAQMDAFSEAMIHDLSTPLSSAILNAEALELSEHNDKKRLERIKRALEMLQQMQQQLRESLVSGSMTLQDDAFDVSDIVHEIAAGNPLLHINARALRIHADLHYSKRMIANLIDNAIKYNRNAQPIRITVNHTTLCIQDSGIGMRDTRMVFERYYREKSSMQGLGIGLSLVKQYCEHYHIRIHIDSTPNVGTTICLDFQSCTTH